MFSIKKNLFNSVEGITSAAVIISFFSLASKIFGLIRTHILMGLFGSGDTLDMYNAAFRIPDTIFNLIIIGALSASFVPILSGYYSKKDNENFFRVANNVLNIFLISVLAAGGLVFFFAPFLLRFIVPGWEGDKFNTTVELTRLMLLSPVFLTLSSIGNGMLQSSKRFLIYAAAPLGYNIGIIFGALFLVKYFGVYGLATGVILGAALQFIIQWPVLAKLGYRYKAVFDIKNSDIRRIFKVMIPRTLSLGVGQLNLLIITSVASTLAAGSLTNFTLATDIQNIFFGIIGISFAVAVFPTLSSCIAMKQMEKFTAAFSQACREIMFFIIPATFFLIIFRSEMVRVIGGIGLFSASAALVTEQILVFLALGLVSQSLISLVVRTYWALGDTKTPFYTSLFGLVVNAIAAFWFGREMGSPGLAIAFSLTNAINCVMLIFYLKNTKINFDRERILVSSFKILLSALFGGSIVWFLMAAFPYDVREASIWLVVFRLVLGSILFAVLFLAAGWTLRMREIFTFSRIFWAKFLAKTQSDIVETI